MKSTFFVTVATAVLALATLLETTSAVAHPEPEFNTLDFDCEDKPDGLYPNPVDCSTFYKCSDGEAYLYDCPDITLFHRDLLVCVFPQDALCYVEEQDPTSPTTAPPVGSSTSTTSQPTTGSEGYTKESTTESSEGSTSPESSSEEEEASTAEPPTTESSSEEEEASTAEPPTTEGDSGEETTAEPPTTEADSEKTTSESSSSTSSQPSTSNPSTTTEKPGFSCEGRPCGQFPYPGNCRYFYRCVGGQLSLGQCSEGLVFNPIFSMCDYVENVPHCQQQPPSTTEQPEAPGTSTSSPSTSSGPANPTTDGPGSSEEDESTTQEPNPTTDGPGSSEEDDSTTQEPNPTTDGPGSSEEDESTTSEPPTSGAPGSSEEESSEESTTEQPSTAASSSPNPSTNQPPSPSTQKTTTVGSSEEDSSSSSSSEEDDNDEFNCNGQEGLFRNPNNCRTFYYCVRGHPSAYLFNCPVGPGGDLLFFNPDLKVCDYQYNVPICNNGVTSSTSTTSSTTTSTSTSTTTRAPPVEFSCNGRPDGLYQNQANCRTFYQCSNGNLYKFKCPGQLFFDPQISACNYSKPVNCPN